MTLVPIPEGKKRGKYGVRTDAQGIAERTVDGVVFASKKEAKRYSELRLIFHYGKIGSLVLQPRYKLEVNGVLICTYVADFSYVDLANMQVVIEDVKGHRTREYILKKRLMLAVHGIEVIEI